MYLLGQARLGRARLAHCMRWLGQTEVALEMMIDRAIQVHGALGYSTDTPLAQMATQACWARFADGADEIHHWRIAQRAIDAYLRDGSVNAATGSLPL